MKQYLNPSHTRINNYSLKYHCYTLFKKIELALFLILSIALLITSKVNREFTDKISSTLVETSLPVTGTFSYPFNVAIDLFTNFEELINAKKENKDLKEQNERMRKNLIYAISIAHENQELKDILKFVIPRSSNYKMAKVIGKTHQVFTHKLFLKSKKGTILQDGNAVVNKIGMIGRVVNANKNKAQLLLLTDATSKVPVIVSNARARGILSGKNSNLMEIEFLPKDHSIEVGDMVFTSSDGENLPPGLLVGIVKKIGARTVYVEPAQDIINADIVTILQY